MRSGVVRLGHRLLFVGAVVKGGVMNVMRHVSLLVLFGLQLKTLNPRPQTWVLALRLLAFGGIGEL